MTTEVYIDGPWPALCPECLGEAPSLRDSEVVFSDMSPPEKKYFYATRVPLKGFWICRKCKGKGTIIDKRLAK